jgi:ABC-2 type transport system ATP-binding protein
MTIASLSPPAHAAPLIAPSTGGSLAASTEGLSKSFGRERALAGVDLRVEQGAVHVLAGANGAGKSTLLRTFLNLVKPDAGRAEVLGMDPRRDAPRVRAQIGYVPEGSQSSYGWMRVGRLLQHHAAYFPSWDADYAAQLSRALDVRPERTLSHLSKGQARRVQLVMALAHRPALLLLDEPTDGLDPVARDDVLGLLSEHLADTGCTVLISTHLVYEVERLADQLSVLQRGRLVAQTSLERLHRQLRLYRVQAPEGWAGPPDLVPSVLRRVGAGREVQWTVWGEEQEVAARIGASGAVVRDVSPLTLDEAVITLLRAKDLS